MPTSLDPLVPPAELLFDGASTTEEFIAVGEGFTHEYLISRGQLKPSERVLDLGSGNGQKARVLTRHLQTGGSYEGLDIVESGIAWCQKAYAAFPNFHFTHASDLYSSHYNPTGTVRAHTYRLPYKDATFDMVFCASLFTHLMPNETANYFREVSRVLRPEGRFVFTAFLLSQESFPEINSGTITFPFEMDGYRVRDAKNPANAVAIQEGFVRETLQRNSLRLCECTYGTWSGAQDLLHALQDCMIAVKRQEARPVGGVLTPLEK